MTAHLDEQTLQELKAVLAADFPLLVDTFVADGDTRLRALRGARAAGNLVLLRETAHSFKGSSLNLGAARLAAMCLAIEQGTREDRVPAPADIDALEAEFRTVSRLLAGA